MEIFNLFPGSFASNCYLLVANGEAAVVDPSASVKDISDALTKTQARLRYVLLTHGHFDHILTLDELRAEFSVPSYIHKDDAEMLADCDKNAFRYFFGTSRTWHPAERILDDGEKLTLGGETIRTLHTPGHSKGSVCYLCNDEFLLTGDTLFDGNVGRYDLWGGDARDLWESLRKLRLLPSHLTIYPGHGGTATLGTSLDAFI